MNSHRKIIHLIVLTCILFLSLIIFLTYFQAFRAQTIVRNPYNRRLWEREEQTVRGNIYDRNGVILAETLVNEGQITRTYPQNRLYSHIVGYSHRQYGRSGLESQYNEDLLGYTSEGAVARIRDRITGEMYKGNHLYLTLNHQIQQKAEELLRGKTGSIVALNPSTGEVLALVSKPDFNPNRLIEDWTSLVDNPQSPLLNRGISGLYPPGSTYKVVITSAVLEAGNIDADYDCLGSINVDGYILTDLGGRGHGPVDLWGSLMVSCNTNFARMALELGDARIREISRRFKMAGNLNADFNIQGSRFPYGQTMTETEIAAVAIGQGKLLVTPIHMALIAATIANEGYMVEPRIIKEIVSPEGRTVGQMTINQESIISPDDANLIKQIMQATVDDGTGRNAQIAGIKVAGKTGTAENPQGESHAWFIAFAPVDEPQIAVAVLLENEGATGGAAAAPIARELIREALKRGVLD